MEVISRKLKEETEIAIFYVLNLLFYYYYSFFLVKKNEI